MSRGSIPSHLIGSQEWLAQDLCMTVSNILILLEAVTSQALSVHLLLSCASVMQAEQPRINRWQCVPHSMKI